MKRFERARYFDYDLECLLDPDPNVRHYEVPVRSQFGAA